MKIRAVLLDMDGTLLGRSQVAVSVKNMRAIQRALKKGLIVIPCTGRVMDMLPPQLLTQEGLRYFITSHGARVFDRETGETIYQDLIPPQQAAGLMTLLQGRGLYNEIAANATIYLERDIAASLDTQPVPEHPVWDMRDRCYSVLDDPAAFFAGEGVGIEKMNLYDIPAGEQQSIYDAITATGCIRHTREGAGPNLEFSHRTLDKLCAVDAVLARLGVSYAETLAIGDSSSDLDIIRACGVGVAMGNAPDDIKAAADSVTSLNTEDGVAAAFEEYLL